MNDEGAARQMSQNPGNDPQKDGARIAAAQGDLLTSDEQLLHKPRWQGGTGFADHYPLVGETSPPCAR